MDCSFAYSPGHDVLRGVSVECPPGHVTAIIGPNAGGKTTLLRLLAGLRTPDRGTVRFEGEAAAEMGALSTLERARRVVYLPQRSEVAFGFSTREVVELGGFAAGRGEKAERAGSNDIVDRALAEVQLAEHAGVGFATLSAGQQQRATLARALVQLDAWRDENGTKRFLLADEPVSAMDPKQALRSMVTIRALASRGFGVVCVLHDLSLALRFADEVVMIAAGGSVLSAGPTPETMHAQSLSDLYGVTFETLHDAEGRPAAFVPTRVM